MAKFLSSAAHLTVLSLYCTPMLRWNVVLHIHSLIRDQLSILTSLSGGGSYRTFSGDRDIAEIFTELSQYKKLLKTPAELLLSKEKFSCNEIKNNLTNNKLIKKVTNSDYSLTTDFMQKFKILQCQSPVSDVEKSTSKVLKEYDDKAASGASSVTNSISQQINDYFYSWSNPGVGTSGPRAA
jgi:hypothetical protein